MSRPQYTKAVFSAAAILCLLLSACGRKPDIQLFQAETPIVIGEGSIKLESSRPFDDWDEPLDGFGKNWIHPAEGTIASVVKIDKSDPTNPTSEPWTGGELIASFASSSASREETVRVKPKSGSNRGVRVVMSGLKKGDFDYSPGGLVRESKVKDYRLRQLEWKKGSGTTVLCDSDAQTSPPSCADWKFGLRFQ